VTRIKTALYAERESRNRSGFYAAPLAWAAADFTRRLIEDEGAIAPHHIGLILVSDECSLAAIRELAGTAREGRISPLRFAGSSPAIVAGLPALEQGIRGPVLALTMRPRLAQAAVMALIRYWTSYSGVTAVIAIAHFRDLQGADLFKGLVATSAEKVTTDDLSQLLNDIFE
jgi:hypothetical protein